MVDLHEVYEGEQSHIAAFWPTRPHEDFVWTFGSIGERLPHFRVRRIEPDDDFEPWIYVTLGAWEAAPGDPHGFEFVLISPNEDPRHVELLAMVTYLHLDPRYRLDVGWMIDIGRPWVEGSAADHLLVTLPFPFGPALEHCQVGHKHIRFLWLVPITRAEAELVRSDGLEALEQRLEDSRVDVADPRRPAVVP